MPEVAAIFFVQVAALLALAGTCYVFGRTALGSSPFQSDLERAAFSVALGMGILGTVLFLIGLAGALYLPLVVAAIACGHALCYRAWRELAREVKRISPGAAIVVAAATLPAFLLSLYPPSAFDETMYHLPYASLFAREHAVVFAGDLRFPVFPQLAHMLFTALYMAFGAVSTHVVQILAALVTSASVAAWSGALEGRRAAMWAAALWAGNPIVVWYAATSYIDLVLTMFVVLSARALFLWKEKEDRAHLLLSAALVAFSAATKYHGLVFVIAFLLLIPGGVRRPARAMLIFAIVSMLLLSPVYARNVAVTGNPVFPFLSPFFGRNAWASGNLSSTGPGDRLTNLVELPLDLVADSERRAGQPPYSPILLLALPAALYDAARRRGVAGLTVVMLGYVALVSSADVRFLFPAVAFLCVLAAARVSRWSSRFFSPAVAALMAIVFVAPGAAYAGFKLWDRGPVPVTEAERHAFLGRASDFFPLIELLNERHDDRYSVYVMFGENARWYARGRFVGDRMGPAKYARVIAVSSDASQLAHELRAIGVDYFLFDSATFKMPEGPQFRLVARSGSTELHAIAEEAGAGPK